MQTKGVREMNATALASSASVPQPVFAFCAIGNPASFLNRLRHDGMQLAKSQIFPDHYSYKQADISELSRQARDAGAASLITTEKDAVKLRHLRFGLPCYALEIAIAIDNEGTLRELVRNAISTG
jgi:tetraacyldisaccharide 4'-kinase